MGTSTSIGIVIVATNSARQHDRLVKIGEDQSVCGMDHAVRRSRVDPRDQIAFGLLGEFLGEVFDHVSPSMTQLMPEGEQTNFDVGNLSDKYSEFVCVTQSKNVLTAKSYHVRHGVERVRERPNRNLNPDLPHWSPKCKVPDELLE